MLKGPRTLYANGKNAVGVFPDYKFGRQPGKISLQLIICHETCHELNILNPILVGLHLSSSTFHYGG